MWRIRDIVSEQLNNIYEPLDNALTHIAIQLNNMPSATYIAPGFKRIEQQLKESEKQDVNIQTLQNASESSLKRTIPRPLISEVHPTHPTISLSLFLCC